MADIPFGRVLPIPESAWSFARSSEPINSDLLPRLPKGDDICICAAHSDDLRAPAARGTRVRVLEKSILTDAEAFKQVYHFAMDGSGLEDWKYQPGDSFDLFCANDPGMVNELLQRLGINGMDVVLVKKHSTLNDVVVSVKELLEGYLDFSHYPKKAFLRHLAEFCSDEEDKRCLLFLSSRLGSSVYLELASQYAGLLDFLATFKSCVPTLDCLVINLPLLSARSYSLITSRLSGGDKLEFIASIDWYETPKPQARRRFGTCSRYLIDRVEVGSQLEIKPRAPNKFHLPQDPNKRILMICAGAGIAPYIGFLRHRRALGVTSECWLFYGFRSKLHDYLFEQEIDGYLHDNTLTRLSTATSRSEPKQYIQDVIWESRVELYDIINSPDTTVYLCGDEMTMIKGVNDVLLRILAENMPVEQATATMKQWNVENKIIRDIWV